MTVYKQQKINQKVIDEKNKMGEIEDEDETMSPINDGHTHPDNITVTEIFGPVEDCNVGGEVIPPEISVSSEPFFHSSDEFEPLSRHYLGDWSEVEHIFKIALLPEPELDYFSAPSYPPSPPGPPSPPAFGFGNELIIQDPVMDDNIHDLVQALDNVILSQPPIAKKDDLQLIGIYTITSGVSTAPTAAWGLGNPQQEQLYFRSANGYRP